MEYSKVLAILCYVFVRNGSKQGIDLDIITGVHEGTTFAKAVFPSANGESFVLLTCTPQPEELLILLEVSGTNTEAKSLHSKVYDALLASLQPPTFGEDNVSWLVYPDELSNLLQ